MLTYHSLALEVCDPHGKRSILYERHFDPPCNLHPGNLYWYKKIPSRSMFRRKHVDGAHARRNLG